jgi:U3 small nucleolar RNA-associated protein 11
VLSFITHLTPPRPLPPVRRKHASYKELSQRLERHQKLSSLASKMEMEKQVMGKGRKRKITAVAEDGSSQAVFKWKKERKR